MKPGTQIIYVPNHADSINHPDCETGFITSVSMSSLFCRYWSKFHSGLRTVSCSESTPFDNVVIKDTVPQSKVDNIMRRLYGKED